MKLLLHICCAPCAIYPVEFLRNKGFEVVGLFYNPNIYPYSEFIKREEQVKKYAQLWGVEVIYTEHKAGDFFSRLDDSCRQRPARCHLCWRIRLEETAGYALRGSFDYFSSTLLVSPYQDIDVIRGLGKSVSEMSGVKFLGEDFRSGFREAHRRAKEKGLYCQKYCGCIYSLSERQKKRKRIKVAS